MSSPVRTCSMYRSSLFYLSLMVSFFIGCSETDDKRHEASGARGGDFFTSTGGVSGLSEASGVSGSGGMVVDEPLAGSGKENGFGGQSGAEEDSATSGQGGEEPSAGQSGSAGSSGTESQAGTSGTESQAGTSGTESQAGTSGTESQAGIGGTDGDCQGHSEVDFSLVGWASQNGLTTGGKNGTTISVSNGEQLAQALKDKQKSDTPLTILVNGTITPGNSGDNNKIDVKRVRDVSIIGTGSGADFTGIGIKIVDASNIVIRNLRVHEVAIGDKDAISIEGTADHIWIDHCELYAEFQGVEKDSPYDGLLDAKADAEYITYSWNYLHDSWKTGLVGSSESDTYDRKVTIHHNIYENCNSRVPLFRAGNGHLFNNYYLDIASTAINSRIGACLKVENNYFSNVHNPWVSAYSDVLGAVDLVCNTVTDGSDFDYSSDSTNEPLECESVVPYSYSSVLNHVEKVPTIVRENAGVGKLVDPTEF